MVAGSVQAPRLDLTNEELIRSHIQAVWLAETGQLPGARICNEHEWERGARGADGRVFPQGDQMAPDDANFDETYGRAPLAYGPDEVGSHPSSQSPFGLLDMTGNAFEWVRSIRSPDEALTRGGSWYYSKVTMRLANREVGEATLRHISLGLRLCATPRRPLVAGATPVAKSGDQ